MDTQSIIAIILIGVAILLLGITLIIWEAKKIEREEEVEELVLKASEDMIAWEDAKANLRKNKKK